MFAGGVARAQERGFEKGQTLPDISLINLEGEEVRFSDFLGKQYVLYGWASW
jgi:peroxiredoxin